VSDRTSEEMRGVWEAKRDWHREQARLPLEEKFRILIEMQQQDAPILAARGALRAWERPWEVVVRGFRPPLDSEKYSHLG
jgi:hypothetical protein